LIDTIGRIGRVIFIVIFIAGLRAELVIGTIALIVSLIVIIIVGIGLGGEFICIRKQESLPLSFPSVTGEGIVGILRIV
jgi:hypothetical protein